MRFGKIILVGIILLLATSASAATYYVDFENGNDNSNGLTQATAWKHAPGDAFATERPLSATLNAGDVVQFRAGAAYKGSISMKFNGAVGNPITYKGEGWGEGKAIIDGSETLTGWTRCASMRECADNPDWQNIYYLSVPSVTDAFSTFLFEGDSFLNFAQDPNPSDPFFYDDYKEFWKINNAQMTATSIYDPIHFNQSESNYWDGAYVLVWRIPNLVDVRKIASFNPATSTITFDVLGGNPYTDKDEYYAVINSIHALDRAGEYYVDEDTKKIYLWPQNAASITENSISMSKRGYGIDLYNRNYITISGFEVKKQAGNQLRDGVGIGTINGSGSNVLGATIKGNYIHLITHGSYSGYGGIYLYRPQGALVENNMLELLSRTRGIFLASGLDSKVKNNVVTKSGATSISYYTMNNSQILGNKISDSMGGHANGITIYIDSKDILTANNVVLNSTNPLTFQDSENLTFYSNVFTGCCTNVANSWGKNRGTILFLNNNFLKSSNHYAVQSDTSDTTAIDANTLALSFKNNITDGGGRTNQNNGQYNLYTGLAWNQKPRYGWALTEGEIDWSTRDAHEIFTDYDNSNFDLRQGSPAINAGTDVLNDLTSAGVISRFPDFDFSKDIKGNVRPQGTAWDIGAYEFVSGSPHTNQNPTVTIIAPLKGALYSAPAAITISANASDSDGTVSKVEFYNGTALLGTDTTTPYTYTWGSVGAGAYSITARVTDNSGASATSGTISIVVNAQGQQFPDDDLDGVPDSTDRCPRTAIAAKSFVNIFGCALPIATKFDIRPDFNATDINGMQSLELGILAFGKVSYAGKNILLVKMLAGEDERLNLDADLNISQGKISLNPENLPQLGAPAAITLYNTNFTNPKILKDGAECTECSILGYDRDAKTLVFTVPGF